MRRSLEASQVVDVIKSILDKLIRQRIVKGEDGRQDGVQIEM